MLVFRAETLWNWSENNVGDKTNTDTIRPGWIKGQKLRLLLSFCRQDSLCIKLPRQRSLKIQSFQLDSWSCQCDSGLKMKRKFDYETVNECEVRYCTERKVLCIEASLAFMIVIISRFAGHPHRNNSTAYGVRNCFQICFKHANFERTHCVCFNTCLRKHCYEEPTVVRVCLRVTFLVLRVCSRDKFSQTYTKILSTLFRRQAT